MHPIERIIQKCDIAISTEDFDCLMENYTHDAVLVIEPGNNAVGSDAIRKAFEQISIYFKHGLKVTQNGMQILESKDTALVLAKTIVESPNQPTEEREATYVFKKLNGRWLCSIDNSYGHQILQ